MSGVATDSDEQIFIYGDGLADVLAAVEAALDAESESAEDDERDDGVAGQERDCADVSCVPATSRSEGNGTGDRAMVATDSVAI